MLTLSGTHERHPVAVVLVELGAGGGNDLRREMNPEVVEQTDEIAAPTGRDSGGAEGVSRTRSQPMIQATNSPKVA